MKKLELYTVVESEDGIAFYIKNVPVVTYNANTAAGFKLRRKSTGEEFDSVTLYKQIFDVNGELLEKPIYDEDDYYLVEDDGTEYKCHNKEYEEQALY